MVKRYCSICLFVFLSPLIAETHVSGYQIKTPPPASRQVLTILPLALALLLLAIPPGFSDSKKRAKDAQRVDEDNSFRRTYRNWDPHSSSARPPTRRSSV